MKLSSAVLLGLLLAGSLGGLNWIVGHKPEVIEAQRITQTAVNELRNPVDRGAMIDRTIDQMDPPRSSR